MGYIVMSQKSKTDWIALRATAAKDLKLAKPTHQDAHMLLVVRFCKESHEANDGDWKKVFNDIKAVGHGFSKNASQFNQWLDRKEDDAVSSDVIADLEV